MRRMILISAAALPVLSTSALPAERTVTFAVENMTCTSCPYIVQQSMAAVAGVRRVEVSYPDRTAVVTFDDAQTTAEMVGAASTNAGYPARAVAPGS